MAAMPPWHDYGNPRVSQLIETISQVASSCRTRLVQITSEGDLCLNRRGDHSDALSHANRAKAHGDLVTAAARIASALQELNACLQAVMHAGAPPAVAGSSAPPAPPRRKK
jgi:hypothetical protein